VDASPGSTDLTFQVNAPLGSKLITPEIIVSFLKNHGVEYSP